LQVEADTGFGSGIQCRRGEGVKAGRGKNEKVRGEDGKWRIGKSKMQK
jgi:hypothetical protein